MQQHEYIGKILPDGHLVLPQSLSENFVPGQKVRVRIEPFPLTQTPEQKQNLDAGTSQVLEQMRNARSVGLPDAPEVLRHRVLLETILEDTFAWKE